MKIYKFTSEIYEFTSEMLLFIWYENEAINFGDVILPKPSSQEWYDFYSRGMEDRGVMLCFFTMV